MNPKDLKTAWRIPEQPERLFIVPGASEPERLAQEMPADAFLFLEDLDWNRDLSPWPEKRAFKGGEDFAGGADALLEALLQVLDQANLPEMPVYLAGYSLAGLFALYACTRTDRFAGAASCSGSLWYPGFIEYLKRSELHGDQIYLSLGDQESRSKSPLLSKVGECTEEAHELLSAGRKTAFEWNPGNHFQQETERLLKGLRWLAAEAEG